MFGRATITLGIGPHSSCKLFQVRSKARCLPCLRWFCWCSERSFTGRVPSSATSAHQSTTKNATIHWTPPRWTSRPVLGVRTPARKWKEQLNVRTTASLSSLAHATRYETYLPESNIQHFRNIRNNHTIMVALWNRADHYSFMLWFVLLLFSFFPRLISAAADWNSVILPHMVWP